MDHIQWYDFLRMATAILACISLMRVLMNARSNWHRYSATDKDYLWAFCALLFLLIEGGIEQIIQNSDGGPRTLLAFIITLVCFRASRRRFAEDVTIVHTKE